MDLPGASAAEEREEIMRPEDESLLDDTALEFVRLFTESPDIPAGSLISEADRRQQALVDGSCRWSRRPGKRRCCGTSLVLDQRVAQEQQTGGRPKGHQREALAGVIGLAG